MLNTIRFYWLCRRSDSNRHELPHTPLKRARLPISPLRLKYLKLCKRLSPPNSIYLFCAGDCRVCGAAPFVFADGEVAVGAEAFASVPAGAVVALALAVAGEAVAAAGEACGVGDGVASADCVSSTERVPVSAGNESVKAINIKAIAAPMVILASSVAVPRGPNAVLETLLAKSAPASDLPGCSNTATTSTMHDKINSPYKT